MSSPLSPFFRTKVCHWLDGPAFEARASSLKERPCVALGESSPGDPSAGLLDSVTLQAIPARKDFDCHWTTKCLLGILSGAFRVQTSAKLRDRCISCYGLQFVWNNISSHWRSKPRNSTRKWLQDFADALRYLTAKFGEYLGEAAVNEKIEWCVLCWFRRRRSGGDPSY